MFLENKLAHNGCDFVNPFAEKFGSTYKDAVLSGNNFYSQVNDYFCQLTFTVKEVEDWIMSLDSYFSPGLDNIHPLFIKKYLLNISGWLTKLIN